MYSSKIKAFAEIDSFSFQEQFKSQIRKRVEAKSKEYILGVDEAEFKEYMIGEYTLEPLNVFKESERVEKPIVRKEKVADGFYSEHPFEREVYHFDLKYTFSGSSILFKIRPSKWTMKTYEISVDNENKEVVLSFKIIGQNVEQFEREKANIYSSAFTNLDNVNVFADQWNSGLSRIVNSKFDQLKSKFKKENDFFSSINIATNKNTESIFTVPAIRKIIIPQPSVDKNKEFASVPSMAMKMYADILKVIYDAGKGMEKKPALYKGKDEEGLRDQFLFILETRYESITATGETFNKRGKTDIILKYAEDNTNVFVAECKFWKGAIEFKKAINQLFDRYLTWRDSKVALIFFVTNKDFSKIISQADSECEKHEYFVSRNGSKGESSLSYKFRLPNDIDKEVFMELVLFHYDQK